MKGRVEVIFLRGFQRTQIQVDILLGSRDIIFYLSFIKGGVVDEMIGGVEVNFLRGFQLTLIQGLCLAW